jgi:cell division septum initiation protein DivIVA
LKNRFENKEALQSEKATKSNNEISHLHQRLSLLKDEVNSYTSAVSGIKKLLQSFQDQILLHKQDTSTDLLQTTSSLTSKIDEMMAAQTARNTEFRLLQGTNFKKFCFWGDFYVFLCLDSLDNHKIVLNGLSDRITQEQETRKLHESMFYSYF